MTIVAGALVEPSLFDAALCATRRISARAVRADAPFVAEQVIKQQNAAHKKIARRQPRRNPRLRKFSRNKKASRE
jgi:hypothetical protein